MHMRMWLIPLVMLLAMPGNVAAQYKKNEFAFGYSMETDGAGAVYSVPLPNAVYAGTVQDNLADVRVFNKEGEEVPHEFRYAEKGPVGDGTTVNVPYFPLSSERGAPADDLAVEIRRSSSGEIVTIEKRPGAAQRPAPAYLLDVSDIETYPVTLQLQWKTTGEGVMVPIILEGSEDLFRWRQVAETTLADLEFMGNRLHNGEVKVSGDPGRYLRLRFGARGDVLRITGIKAISDPQPAGVERSWVDLELQRLREQGTLYLEARLPGSLPADRLQFRFPSANSILHARIYARNANELWRFRGETLFYELLEDGARLRNDPLVLPRENVRFFRLEVLQDGMGDGGDHARLRVGYIPHDLIFIARGSGPFILAYGNGRMKTAGPGRSRAELHGLIGEKNRSIVHPAQLGERVILGGEKRLEGGSEPPWKKIALWLVLLAGVAVLALMAWSLARKMNRT